jgi:hypothetical protein
MEHLRYPLFIPVLEMVSEGDTRGESFMRRYKSGIRDFLECFRPTSAYVSFVRSIKLYRVLSLGV